MAEERGLVSVVLPMYNGAEYVLQAVQSILKQTYRNLELIAIDDASTDATPEIVSKVKDSRLVFLRNETNLGVAETLNRGLSTANGEFVARMDADDVSHRKRLELQVRTMVRRPYVGLVGAWVEAFGDIRRQRWRGLRLPPCHDDIAATLFFRNCLAHPTVVFRKSVLETQRLRYDRRDIGCEDFGLWTRVVRSTKAENLPLVLLRYRVHRSGMSSIARVGDERRCRAMKRILRDYAVASLQAERGRELIDILNGTGYYPGCDPRTTLEYCDQLERIAAAMPAHTLLRVIRRERARAFIDARLAHQRLRTSIGGRSTAQAMYLLREVTSRLLSRV